jgi:hypothetical protein
MAVNFRKPAHVLAVHGVQTGEDSDIKSADQIRALINRSLSDSDVVKDFLVKPYLYEGINNDAQSFYKLIGSAITSGKPLAGKVLSTLIDALGDVVTATRNTSTAGLIRKGLRDSVLESYRSGNQLIIIAHSLGTVYALDVINELIGMGRYYKGDDTTSWPVQGLVTMGSPLGLALDILGMKVFEQRVIRSVPDAEYELFPWHNYYNRLDPIVSGSIFGNPVHIENAKGPVELRYGPSILGKSWLLRGHVVTSGQQWLFAHTAYWNNPTIGDRLVDMLWG